MPPLIDSQTLNSRFKRGARDTQPRCRTRWPCYAPFARSQRLFNDLFFSIVERRFDRNALGSAVLMAPLQPRFVDRKRVTVAKDHCPFNKILKFANIARPIVLLK